MNAVGWSSVVMVGALATYACVINDAWLQLGFFWAAVALGVYASYKSRNRDRVD